MSTGEIVAYVIVPLALFILTSMGGGVMGVIKLTNYLTRSQSAQESTAKSNREISDNLKQFIGETNQRLNDHGERISVLEDRTGVR